MANSKEMQIERDLKIAEVLELVKKIARKVGVGPKPVVEDEGAQVER
jgi:hypothetical protein